MESVPQYPTGEGYTKFTEDPLCDLQEPSEPSRHTCGTSLESSSAAKAATKWERIRLAARDQLSAVSIQLLNQDREHAFNFGDFCGQFLTVLGCNQLQVMS